MLGISLQVDETDQYLVINIAPDQVKDKVEANDIFELIQKSKYKNFFIFDESIIDVVNSYKLATTDNTSAVIEHQIGKRTDTKIKFRIFFTNTNTKTCS